MKVKRVIKVRRVISLVIILVGVIVISYPFIADEINNKRRENLISELENAMTAIEYSLPENVIRVDLSELDIPSTEASDPVESLPDSEELVTEIIESSSEEEVSEKKEAVKISSYPVEGVLYIDKIDLTMPVINGVSEEHLNISIVSLETESKPWTSGNYAIVGHRSTHYGRMFNRLNEVVKGDKISFKDRDGLSYNYKVTSNIIVHESEIWVLENRGIDEITLVTCDPIGQKNPDMRLVVFAERLIEE